MEGTLASRLKAIRVARGWTQEEAADRAGLSQAYLSQLEVSEVTNPTIDVVLHLANAYYVDPLQLIGWNPWYPEQLDPELRRTLESLTTKQQRRLLAAIKALRGE